MADEWTVEGEEAPRKKGGVPTWVWIGCGGGCFLAIVVLVVLAVVGVRFFEQAADPEVQWENLREELPYDERPEHLEMQVGMSMFGMMETYSLADPDEGTVVTVMVFGGAAAADFDEMFVEDPAGTPFGMGEPRDPVVGTMDLQGEEVRYLAYSGLKGQPGGGGMRVDLTPPGGKAMLAQFQRLGVDEPPSEEYVREFFEPFDLWRER